MCQGPLRGAVLIHTQVVTLLTDGVIWLYSISVIALISLAKVEGGFYASPNFIYRYCAIALYVDVETVSSSVIFSRRIAFEISFFDSR